MIHISSTLDIDILYAYRDLMRDLPKVSQKAFKGILDRRTKQMQRELSKEPSKPRYPLRWKSARQRRYVMAKLRREGNLPYSRTHRLAQGWKIKVLTSANETVIVAENPAKEAVYVQGDYAQPMHLDTGWPQAAPIYVKYQELIQDDLIQTWYSLVEFVGTR